MEWKGGRRSRNVEDLRRQGPRTGGGGLRIGGLGAVIMVLLGLFLGVDVTPLLQGQGPGGGFAADEGAPTAADEERADFAAVVLGYTEDLWAQVFAEQVDGPYRPPVLKLYRVATESPCGGASGATGPFYCPADRKIYLDTDFFVAMERQLGASGDFAQAYVIAHEVAHHIQNELGILPEVNALRARASEADSNAWSVRIELQADCLAGIWAHAFETRTRAIEPGDLDEALNAARAIGDDRLQRAAGQRPMPHTFTHGTSEQRARWFARGYRVGRIDACDAINATRL
jgi:hypothetical protein